MIPAGQALAGDFAEAVRLLDAGRSVIRVAEPPPGTFAEPGLAVCGEVYEGLAVHLPTHLFLAVPADQPGPSRQPREPNAASPARRSVSTARSCRMFGGIFCCLLGIGASLATVPFFVLRQLHGGNVEAGVAVAALSVAAVIARPVAGRLADRHGYKVGDAVRHGHLRPGRARPTTAPDNIGLLVAVRIAARGRGGHRLHRRARPGWSACARPNGAAGSSACTASTCGWASRWARWPAPWPCGSRFLRRLGTVRGGQPRPASRPWPSRTPRRGRRPPAARGSLLPAAAVLPGYLGVARRARLRGPGRVRLPAHAGPRRGQRDRSVRRVRLHLHRCPAVHRQHPRPARPAPGGVLVRAGRGGRAW